MARPRLVVTCGLGFEHLLKDIQTVRARCEALGIPVWKSGTQQGVDLFSLCSALEAKGITFEEFMEGLPRCSEK